MEFIIKTGSPVQQRTGCIVLGVFDACKLSNSAAAVDRASAGFLREVLSRGDLDGKPGSTLLLHAVPGIQAERVLLVGLGRENDLGDKEFRTAVTAATRLLNQTGCKEAALFLTEIRLPKREIGWRIRQAIIVASDCLYRFDRLKSKKEEIRPSLEKLVFHANRSELQVAETAAREARAIASGIGLAKNLANLPGNICTPTFLAEQAADLGSAGPLEVEVLDREQMVALGMNTLLSVAKGSHQPPKFIVLTYRGSTAKSPPVVLIGKGITFDSGGISLKPGADMDEMKYDMCGAASVMGTLHAVASLGLPLNVVGLIPATENMPGGGASKPGDIVTSMSGQTVEILNTDAEGRLILCDALTYAKQLKPACVIDVATLTGACVISLGHVASGLFANDDELAKKVLDASEECGDRVWQMPLWDDYQEQLKSNFADMANIGGRAAGSITAACFLSRFARDYSWAHLDIAGTAWRSGKDKGATGRPVSLLVHVLIDRSRRGASPRRRK